MVQSKPELGRIGLRVLNALLDAAKARAEREVMLQAQARAEEFYLKRGFVRSGDYFVEAGITHIEMVLPLSVARRPRTPWRLAGHPHRFGRVRQWKFEGLATGRFHR
jgi:Acetyltransferase (GNAT) domain